MGRLLYITPAIFFALAISLAAQTPRIVSLSAEPVRDSLAVNVQLEDLFPTKIANTIRSGLPTVIRFDFRLIDESGREVLRLTEAMEILYDIWAQRFRITLDDQQHFAASFEEMKKENLQRAGTPQTRDSDRFTNGLAIPFASASHRHPHQQPAESSMARAHRVR
ncbi:hypothetical protein DCC62_09120 [candidate division KSB1 bacterium]|nr:MAG: hypothetical protein DCC62_09120 [candidate division KSB1 bacterium]